MMLAALVILLAQAAATPTDAQIAGWIEDLSASVPYDRANAARRLLEAGDVAAEALEAAELEDPEAIAPAPDQLSMMSRPTVPWLDTITWTTSFEQPARVFSR